MIMAYKKTTFILLLMSIFTTRAHADLLSVTEDAICERIKGKLYCWNTPKELYARCRTAIPDQTACHPGEKCYHATNTYGEDVPGNCHWGYFSWKDAQQWCLSKNGRLLSKNEIDLLWEDFKRFDPPWGQNPCYWTSTSRGDGFYWCKGRDKDGAGHGGWTRKDGYFAAGGSLCLIDSKK